MKAKPADSDEITIALYTNFEQYTSASDIEKFRTDNPNTKLFMIKTQYKYKDAVISLPEGSAKVTPTGPATASTGNLNPNAELSSIEEVSVIDDDKGEGFDGCNTGSIAYYNNAWYYNCTGGSSKNVGPFYIYTYETQTITFSADDVEIKIKDGFKPLIEAGEVDGNWFEAVVKIGDDIYTVPYVNIDPDDNRVDPLTGDTTVTILVGDGTSNVRKEVTAGVKLTSSDIRVKLNTSKYSGTSSKTFTTDDVVVEYRVNDQWYETDRFELLDATVNPLNGDTRISISFAGVNKVVEAAVPITGNVSANGTTDIKELVQSVQTIQAKPNSVIANNSITAVKAAIDIMKSEKLNQYVTEAIGLGDANVIVKDDGTAAKLQAKVNTMDASVITNALTPEEIVKVLSGEKVDLRLEVVVDETSNAKETTGGQLIEKNLETNQNAYYFTADLFKIFNDNEDDKSSITEFSDAISFTIDIPEELRSEGRAFTLIASHENADGTFETFELVDTDDNDATFTASTNKLCTMALVYADEVVMDTPIEPVVEEVYDASIETPQTGDSNLMYILLILAVLSAVVLVSVRRREVE